MKNSILFAMFFLIFLTSISFGLENIPLDSWIYKDLLKLEAYGLIDDQPFNQKPYSRKEITSVLFKTFSIKSKNFPIEIKLILERLKLEFSDEFGKVYGNINESDKDEELKVREIKTLFVNAFNSTAIYEKHGNLFYYSDYPEKSDLKYSKTLEGQNLWLKTNLFYNYKDKLGISYRPFINFKKDESSYKNNEYIITLEYDKLDFILGRENIFWGPGQHGSLLVSDNAYPREMFQIRNNLPIILPWFLDKLGPLKFHLFFSKLDDERQVPNTLFSGIKMNFAPNNKFEFGLSKVVLSGGDGEYNGIKYEKQTGLEMLADLIATSPRELNKPGYEDIITDTDQIWGVDYRFKIPQWSLFLYGEYMQEDYRSSLRDWLKSEGKDRGTVFGWYWLVPFDDYKTNILFEYATTTNSWYNHGKYTDGYIYKQKIIGHHMGTDADDLWFKLERNFNENFFLEYSYDKEQQGLRDNIVISKKIQHTINTGYKISEKIKSNLFYSEIKHENPEHKLNESNINNYLLGIDFLFIF